MAHLDRFLTVLASNGATALRLATDDVAQLDVGGASRPITKQPFTTPQLTMLLREIAPASAMAELEGQGETSFSYALTGAEFTARVTQSGGRLSAVITPSSASQAAPDLSTIATTRATAHTAIADDAARAEIERLLRTLVEKGASDLHLRVGEPPILRTNGEIHRLEGIEVLTNERLEAMLRALMPDRNRAEFRELNDTDFAYEIEGCARFRCNALRDRKGAGAVFRVIPATIVSAEQLGLSEEVQRLCFLTKGLVLVTGPTGSGKSTTLCGLIDLINRVRSDHVITIEDPIEFVHSNKRCIITQRQVGVHTSSFKHALRAALREDPDIILVGELRDLETVSIAIETAETGHLVFGTLHTTTAASTIDRLIDQFPADRQDQIRVMLSESLKGVISQTLCKKIGGGRVAAREVLLSVPAIANLIREGKTFQIPSIIQTSKRLGMVTLNDALIELVDGGEVEPKEAYFKATDKQGFGNMLRQRNHDTSFLDEEMAASSKPTPGGVAPARPGTNPPAAGARSGAKPVGARS
ncbi:MAG TPA: type IV pilus twitching motility protein PilT [Gemmatimonadaceae bacterium]|nr:type IV pilus twitching motility protein PilT [Gemmatimonadaceae bacterium]